ncbi:hypothetical protein CK203_062167 [Vitis vinifera]|uniref:Uncharacterized protein n=1 Tax=Vitis vinifera TaxID=29760 RepID=A0A438GD87_VITVI|nr:hypothetical protein CK203_062167 [Vitis vinifera]
MLEGKAVIGETDMLQTMQQDALDLAAKALDFFDVTEATEIARFIKKVKNLIGRMDLGGSALLERILDHLSHIAMAVSSTFALPALQFALQGVCWSRGSGKPDSSVGVSESMRAPFPFSSDFFLFPTPVKCTLLCYHFSLDLVFNFIHHSS